MKRLVIALVTILFASSATLADEATASIDTQALYTNPEAQAAFITKKIKEHFPRTYPTMIAIASCESHRDGLLVHWEPDGSLRPNEAKKSSAAGVFQVTLYGHRDAIASLGLDMNNIDDYLTFVKYLVDGRNGKLTDWNASRHCWAPRVASN